LTPTKPVTLTVEVVDQLPPNAARGDYLECAQMLVDSTEDGVRATTARGAVMIGTFGEADESWHMTVPSQLVEGGWWPEIEDLVSLVVTTGWRRAAWVPIHAAGLVKGNRGLLVCASSRGGKTTFSLAMARRRWRLVGDDKLLVGRREERPIVAAVKHTLNLDPAAGEWFAEVGDLTHLPIYSEWSPKRRVELSSIFEDAAAAVMLPSHVVVLTRVTRGGEVRVARLDAAERISALLHQTVVPTEPKLARFITATLATLASSLQGVRVEIPDDVYRDQSALDVFEQAVA
jgi:hypothetical protein